MLIRISTAINQLFNYATVLVLFGNENRLLSFIIDAAGCLILM